MGSSPVFHSSGPGVVKGLAKMPDNTVIDGEVIAFDEDGRASFNALQNYGSAATHVERRRSMR
jgi:ATP-dependent DNA ligase